MSDTTDKAQPAQPATTTTYTSDEVAALLAKVDTTSIAARPIARREFSQSERDILRNAYALKATDAEFENLIAIASNLGLDPFKRQCHFVSRRTNKGTRERTDWVDVWAVQVGIDGFRSKAEETGLYAGQDEPEFEDGPNGRPVLARVRVYRRGWDRPAVGVAYFAEFAQSTGMWEKMPHNQLAKCAEAQALRKAFPVLNGIYAPEEWVTSDGEVKPGRSAGGRPAIAPSRPAASRAEPVTAPRAAPEPSQPRARATNGSYAGIKIPNGRGNPPLPIEEASDDQLAKFIAWQEPRLADGKVDEKYIAATERALSAARAILAQRQGVVAPEDEPAPEPPDGAGDAWGS